MSAYRPGIVFIGMETSGALRRRFQAAGHETYSCDLLPCEDEGGMDTAMSDDGLPLGQHIVGDVFQALDNLWATDLWPALAIFHPTCTEMTNAAAWALCDPDYEAYPGVGYHQRVKPGTLVGAARRAARDRQLGNVRTIFGLPIERKVIENPVGAINTEVREASQIIQPNQFGDDASKGTCLWFVGKDGRRLDDMVLPIDPSRRHVGRVVERAGGVGRVMRWGNQTDSGQNALSPAGDRWKDRSRTFPGIADAMVETWVPLIGVPPLVLF